MTHHCEHSWIEPGQPQTYTTLASRSFGFRQHLQRSVLEVEDAAEIERYHIRLCLGYKPLNLLSDVCCVGEKHSPLRSDQKQSWEGLVIRMLLGSRAEHVGARLPSQHTNRRIRHLLSKGHNRHEDGNKYPLQSSEKHHTSQRRQCP